MWDWVLGVNLTGVVNGVQTFVPRMIERGGDAYVVNTASGAGLVVIGSSFMYNASKFGVVGLSEGLRNALARRGIGVSVLCRASSPPTLRTTLQRSIRLKTASTSPG